MNAASWVILGIVLLIVGLAIRATFFGKKGKGSCCDCGDEPMSCSSAGCGGCPCCGSCPSAQAHQ